MALVGPYPESRSGAEGDSVRENTDPRAPAVVSAVLLISCLIVKPASPRYHPWNRVLRCRRGKPWCRNLAVTTADSPTVLQFCRPRRFGNYQGQIWEVIAEHRDEETGVDVVGDMPWATLCLFTKRKRISRNIGLLLQSWIGEPEFCLWVVAEPYRRRRKACLETAVPEFDRYFVTKV
jgi:hypothetical protein